MTRARPWLGLCILLAFGSSCRSPGIVGRDCETPGCVRPAIQCSAEKCSPECPPDMCMPAQCQAGECADASVPATEDASVPAGGDEDRGDDCKNGTCTPREAPCDGGMCSGEEPYCAVDRGRCVECLDATQCGDDEPYCIDGDCEECRDDADCSAPRRCRDGDCELLP